MRQGKRQLDKIKAKNAKKSDSYAKKIGSPILEERVFPIYAGNTINNQIEDKVISGTAFPIGEDYFLTANHVVDLMPTYSNLRLGYLNQITPGCVEKHEMEIVEKFPESDLALIKCESIYSYKNKPKPFYWAKYPLKYFTTIRAMGYPHAFDPGLGFTTSRALQGTKVGSIHYNDYGINAKCYELSFQCPRGLSGTCLLDEFYRIHGVVFRNSIIKYEVFRSTEHIRDETTQTQETTIVEETSFIGLAIQAFHIFDLHSEVLGMNFHQYLINQNLH